jgi:hypothetical protein
MATETTDNATVAERLEILPQIIRRDGVTLAVVANENEALSWLHRYQSSSVYHALEHEGYSIDAADRWPETAERPTDGRSTAETGDARPWRQSPMRSSGSGSRLGP